MKCEAVRCRSIRYGKPGWFDFRYRGAAFTITIRGPKGISNMQKTLYVDMDNVLVDFPSAFTQIAPAIHQQFDGRLDEVPGIFALMTPMLGAIAAYEELASLYDTYVLSTSPWENSTAWSDKLLWIKKHLGKSAYKRLILSHHKHLNVGHYLIDDRTKNGADKFQGEHIHFGTPRFPDWAAVLTYLRARAA